MNKMRSFCGVVLFSGVVAWCSAFAGAQPDSAPSTTTLSQDEIQKLVAPIALYPDPLLAQILPAATYPLDVVIAAQWLAANPNPTQTAIDAQPWDPSVKALIHYPTVLQKMGGDVNWIQGLGTAFLNQQADVMGAVQTLRSQAENANALASTPQQNVTTTNGDIAIEPTNPDMIYVPSYNPVYEDDGWTFNGGITYGVGYPLGFWMDSDFDWRRRGINIGADWNQGWRGRWQGEHGNHNVGRPAARGRAEVSRPWTHDNSRPGPVLPAAFGHPSGSNEHRGYAPAAARSVAPAAGHEPARAAKPTEPARPSGGTFGPVQRAPQVERSSARGHQSSAPAPARQQVRPAQQAPAQQARPAQQQAQRSAPPQQASPQPSAFHASAPGPAVQQQSARGNASRERR